MLFFLGVQASAQQFGLIDHKPDTGNNHRHKQQSDEPPCLRVIECAGRHKQQRTDHHYSQDELRQGLKEQFEGHGIYNLIIYNLVIYNFFIHFVHTICFAVWVIYNLVICFVIETFNHTRTRVQRYKK